MGIPEAVKYFRESAESDWETAVGLFKKLKRYDSALFFATQHWKNR